MELSTTLIMLGMVAAAASCFLLNGMLVMYQRERNRDYDLGFIALMSIFWTLGTCLTWMGVIVFGPLADGYQKGDGGYIVSGLIVCFILALGAATLALQTFRISKKPNPEVASPKA